MNENDNIQENIDYNNVINNNKNNDNINDNLIINENKNNNNNLNDNSKNEEIEENQKKLCEIIFKEINQSKFEMWETSLNSEIPDKYPNLDDCDILSIEECDEKTQKVIINDVQRTRHRERFILPNFKDLAIFFLDYYIQSNNIKYKQGLNEILAPFLLLKGKLKLNFSRIFKFFSKFIDKFLTNYYKETEFFSLQSSLNLLTILLRYHEPEIYNLFDNLMISPEIYATNWILTMFSNKTDLEIIYHFWDKLICFNNNLFIHFFIIALLRYNRDILLNNKDISMIPTILSEIGLKSIKDVDNIIIIACNIIDKTPYSFNFLAEKLEIFKLNPKNLQESYENFDPDKFLAMPIFPNEICNICYREIIACPNENCVNFNIKNKKYNKNEECFYCNNINIKSCIPFYVFDLRCIEENYPKFFKPVENIKNSKFMGILNIKNCISKDEIENIDFPKNIINKYYHLKNQIHILIITSKTDYFKEFEKQFYDIKSNDEEEESKQTIFGFEHRENLEMNTKKIKSKIKKDKKFIKKIQEYDNLKKMIEEMIKENFSNISYVYGGFEAIHDFLIKNNINILCHGEKCKLCEKNKNLFGGFSTFFTNKLNNIFKKDNNNNNINNSNNILINSSIISINKIMSNKNFNFPNEFDLDFLTNFDDQNIIQYFCIFIDDEKNLNIKNEKLQNNLKTNLFELEDVVPAKSLIIFLTMKKIFFYEKNNNNDEIKYFLFLNLDINSIQNLKIKERKKVTIEYKNDKKKISFITIEFMQNIDATSFRTRVKKIKQRLTLIK